MGYWVIREPRREEIREERRGKERKSIGKKENQKRVNKSKSEYGSVFEEERGKGKG